jgi:hypothetical protein
MKTNTHFWSCRAQFFLEWEMFHIKFVEKFKTHILFKYCLACWIMWKYIVEPDRPQMTIWRKSISSWEPEATNTHSKYIILIALPLQQWLHERASLLRCGTYITCLIIKELFKVLSRFLLKNKKSLLPFITVLKVFTIILLCSALPLCPNLKPFLLL